MGTSSSTLLATEMDRLAREHSMRAPMTMIRLFYGSPVIRDPLDDVYYKNETAIAVKSEGVQYFHWNHTLDKMILSERVFAEKLSPYAASF